MVWLLLALHMHHHAVRSAMFVPPHERARVQPASLVVPDSPLPGALARWIDFHDVPSLVSWALAPPVDTLPRRSPQCSLQGEMIPASRACRCDVLDPAEVGVGWGPDLVAASAGARGRARPFSPLDIFHPAADAHVVHLVERLEQCLSACDEVVHVYETPNNGFGSNLQFFTSPLLHALTECHGLAIMPSYEVKNKFPYAERADCPAADFTCFIKLPIRGKCVRPRGWAWPSPHIMAFGDPISNVELRRHEVSGVTRPHFVPPRYADASKGVFWMQTILLSYLWAPQEAMLADARARIRFVVVGDPVLAAGYRPSHRAIAMHIRHGDSCKDVRRFRHCLPLSTYMEAAEAMKAAYGVSTIRLATDSAAIIRDIADRYAVAGSGWLFVYQDMSREAYTELGKSGFHQDIEFKLQDARFNRTEEGLRVLADLDHLVHGGYVIGSFASNLARIVLNLVAANVGRLPPYISVDGTPWCYHWGRALQHPGHAEAKLFC
ncbi:uncharacterized protein AMSG_04158 [Thecamonas trahens ATCC 50062]|uniref:Uncharacterized protein n=1 Tax=Thecamonas trahens ATCC 50062 TaxID=461836 RepID=A0A0L0D9E5_THETB|nr:hypothetical protein AMSG_04158 [Thecamonas trahens ATCC 50062]KNC47923.1 hypothetical protein AMSG_04158 [Thecamonas trahens ATCC 50062]|eukprot:XP_013758942.1 hypothetical protein AMSG_04158 [Thecamonas trahens ATCC 50062]